MANVFRAVDVLRAVMPGETFDAADYAQHRVDLHPACMDHAGGGWLIVRGTAHVAPTPHVTGWVATHAVHGRVCATVGGIAGTRAALEHFCAHCRALYVHDPID